MPTELLPLSKIFNSRLFRIPDYQRGYAWGPRQLADFWADLERAASGRKHYCGQLTLERTPKKSWEQWTEDRSLVEDASYEPYYVVDGQQRLTTAIVLIHCLLEGIQDGQLLAGLSAADRRSQFLIKPSGMMRYCLFGYEKDNPSHEFFRTQVLGSPSNEYRGIQTSYTENLKAALTFFRDKTRARPASRESWFRAIIQQFQFNVYELSDEIDVFVAFETMNNRGKPLTRLELLKNRLIYLSTLAPGSEPERQKVRANVNAVWKTIYEELGKQPSKPLDDDEFLRAHWIVYFGYDKDESDPLTQFLLNRHFTAERVDSGDLRLSDLQSYLDSLQECVRQWQWMHFPASYLDQLGKPLTASLQRLTRLGFGVLKPLLLSVMASGTNSLVKMDAADEAERFLLLVRSLGAARSHVGEADSYRRAHEIFAGVASKDSAGQLLMQRVSRHFTTAIFQTEVDDLYADEDGKGFYDLAALDYILFEYEEDLRIKGKNLSSKLEWNNFRGARNSIEHVYPQDPKEGTWTAFDRFTDEQRRFLCHSFGNLVAVSVAKNSSLSRSSFPDKKAGTDKIPGFSQGSYSELQIAQAADWTATEILERGLALLKFIEDRWTVSLGDRATKVRLLKLDFLEPS